MKQHLFRITVDHLQDKEGNAIEAEPLVFNAPNHDNLLEIVDKVKNREHFTPEMAARFAIGLKLMGEVILENKEMDFFKEIQPHFLQIMSKVKGK